MGPCNRLPRPARRSTRATCWLASGDDAFCAVTRYVAVSFPLLEESRFCAMKHLFYILVALVLFGAAGRLVAQTVAPAATGDSLRVENAAEIAQEDDAEHLLARVRDLWKSTGLAGFFAPDPEGAERQGLPLG